MTISKIALLNCLLLASALVYADCPDGSRTTTAVEREDFIATTTALKAALPQAPAGWRLLDRAAKFAVDAPSSTCKGEQLVPGYFVTYIWTEQEQRVRKLQDDKSKRIAALQMLTPEEQKQLDDLSKQARALEHQAIAVLHTNPDEAARLRKQEEPFNLQARAIRQAHMDRILPQLNAIQNETVSGVTGVSTEVQVSITARRQASTGSAKAEPVKIASASKASYDGKDLSLTLGRDNKGRAIEAIVTGTRSEAEVIGNLLASSLNTLTAKD